MKKLTSYLSLLAVASVMAAGVSPANATLQARGATSALNGFPTWYQDTNLLALAPCLDQVAPTACVLEPAFDPAGAGFLPITQDKAVTPLSATTFPGEAFYFMASTSGVSGGIEVILYEAAIEAGFVTPVPLDGQQAAFSRIRIRANVSLPGTYTLTHPYGVETFDVAAVDPGSLEINFTSDVPGLVAGAFDTAVTTAPIPGILPIVGPTFLTRADGTLFTHPVTGDKYIGDNATPVLVQGGLNGINSVTLTGPAGTFVSNTFILMGKTVGMELTPPANTNFGITKTNSASPTPMTFSLRNLSGAPISPAFTFAPATAGFAVAPASTCIAAAPVAIGATCTFDVTFTPTVDGAQTAELTISDAAAPSVKTSVIGTGDGIAPVAAVTGISRFTPTAIQTISGTVTDLNGVPANGVQVAIDGGAPAAATVTGGTWTFSTPALAVQDPVTGLPVHNIVVTANDNALPAPGNLATPVNETIVVDQTLPVVTLTLEGEGTRTKVATPIVNFLATDINLASTIVKLDGTIMPTQPLSGAAMAKLADGLRTVRVEGTDSAGNAAFKEVSLTVDTIVSPFTLTAVTTPTRTTTQTIKGTVEANSTVQVKVGAAAAAAATVTPGAAGAPSTWSFPIATLAEGVNTITVTAADDLGNLGTPQTSSIKIVFPDGKITGAATVAIADALKSLQFAAGLNKPSAEEALHADVAPLVNGVPAPDGKIDIGDVVLILRKAVGLVNF